MSNMRADAQNFFEPGAFILYGESPRRKTFARVIREELEKNNRQVFSAKPLSDNAPGSSNSLAGKTDRAIIAMSRINTKAIINELKMMGITSVFLQNGS